MKKVNSFLIKLVILLVLCLALSIILITLDSVIPFLSSLKVVSAFPQDGAQGVSLSSSLVIKFNKPIQRREVNPLISPEVHGEWRFEDSIIKNHLFRTLVFIPAVEFEPDTQYQVKLENIKGFGSQKSSAFQFGFQTQPIPQTIPEKNEPEEPISEKPKVTILDISLDWQDRPLSCEAASLKMALAGKGVYVSEKEIMEKIGSDLTPRKGNIWGNPYETYVGDINGKMCKTGYGVYWEPVEKAAQDWRTAQAFSGWSIKDVVREIKAGNPIVIWGVLPTGTLTDCSWQTSQGEHIPAFKETHVRLLVGFIGPSSSPIKIIINDPLAGKLYWSTDYFLENWEVFNYSGVVVR